MKKKLNVAVFLTRDAAQYLEGEAVMDFVTGKNVFRCESYEQNGSFLEMKVLHDHNGTVGIVEVSIPVAYVAFTVAGSAAKKLGFEVGTAAVTKS